MLVKTWRNGVQLQASIHVIATLHQVDEPDEGCMISISHTGRKPSVGPMRVTYKVDRPRVCHQHIASRM